MNEWKSLKEEPPKSEKFVVVSRQASNKYTIAKRYFVFDHDTSDYISCWVTQNDHCYPTNEQDLWLEFKHLEIQKKII